ncbi:MAG: DUF2304 domain-containing protein [Candidatus Omnitrophica bacterium]|nr:DUF2304 domain-containing protein [Candidatus Omnitrophota bacterium]
MSISLLAFLLAFFVFIFVVELIRRERLTFKYAFAWLFFALAGILFALFPQWIFSLSAFFGFALPSNFIFFALLGTFIFLSLLLTVFLCQQNKRNDRMAQRIGLLELEIETLKDRT